ncbi:MAG: type II toxin-antitoxin system HipA family toxin [Coriobacteriales bacterium]|jgi:serine/threonine-protein kinase HipA|nr:type II toxin-antitoxin system HipA family toxin [Coriobacteriales bacterium]
MTLSVRLQRRGVFQTVGSIEVVAENNGRFTYSDEWCSRPSNPPLSLSLPLKRRSSHSALMRPYFEGLLPEADARKAIADKLGISEHSYLHILQALGDECIGAVTVTDASGAEHAPEPRYQAMGPKELRALSDRSFAETAILAERSRLSLSGGQAKAGLYQGLDGSWYLPTGTAPSTHIVKPSSARFPDIVINEAICMMAAEKCGIPAAKVEVFDTGRSPLLSIARFDRTGGLGSISAGFASGLPMPLRLHQEDLCQALGVLSSSKYESRESRYLSKAAKLIRGHSVRPVRDIKHFWDSIAFNYLIGNCDNHIKNYSLVYDEEMEHLRLAPCYDLVCTTMYPELSRDMGIHIGSKLDIDSIEPADFGELADVLTLGREEAFSRLDAVRARLVDALEQATDSLAAQGHKDARRVGKAILGSAKDRLGKPRA